MAGRVGRYIWRNEPCADCGVIVPILLYRHATNAEHPVVLCAQCLEVRVTAVKAARSGEEH